MKKRISLLLFFCFSITSSLNAQSIVLSYNEEDVTNSEFTVEGLPTDYYVKAVIYITNKAESEVSIKVKRTSSNVVEGTFNSFCLGNCYPPSTDESTSPFSIAAGATTGKDDFYLEFYPEGTAGESTISFEIWDVNNTESKATFTVTFSIHSSTGIAINQSISSLSAYPNPLITNKLNITFSFPSFEIGSKITVRNILGVLVNETYLQENSGTTEINFNSLPNGIYVYSIETSSRKILSKRLVVNRE